MTTNNKMNDNNQQITLITIKFVLTLRSLSHCNTINIVIAETFKEEFIILILESKNYHEFILQ